MADLKKINKIVWWIPSKKIRNFIREYTAFAELGKDYNQKCRTLIDKTARLLTVQNNNDIKKRLFKENVYLVEIGISSYCNRKCWFCPNSIVDRRSNNIQLDEKLFLKVINELKEINYSGIINLHRYNEPLYDMDLLRKRIEQINEYIPNSNVQIFTNGDYLNIEYLELLRNLNVKNIIISYYYDSIDKNIEFDIDNIIQPGMDKLLNKLKLEYNILKRSEYYIKIKYYDMNIIYKAQNFKYVATTRGETITDIKLNKRTMQCFMPVIGIQVDYDGNYTPCCEIRSDIESHKQYILGNIQNDTIFDVYTNEKMTDFRKDIFLIGDKKHVCMHCAQGEYNMPGYF
ncbi:radical SAM/SPASM domain-containing protein [uncultured Brachyspira sp.]|uniref:radical SAM/SPASM domain-containing protein n=1 Tax=uncultured Brachyspira sp. TaxID=221953 RepID=UPI00262E184C|nr:radical SAM/SPASM domain-containing protein [uncultured Brachyspira sp.]